MKKIKLYTIQDYSVYLKLKEQGFYKTDKRFICANNFKEAYNWLFEESKKIHSHWKESRPVWAWLKRPDLRTWKYFRDSRKGSKVKMVLIEFVVEEKDLIITDYDSWHCVLNNSLYTESDKAWDEFQKKYVKNYEVTKKGMKIMKESWKRCLNPLSTDCKQAIVEEIRKEQVVKVTPFYSFNKHS